MKKFVLVSLVIAIVLGFSGCDMYKGKRRIVGVSYEHEIFNAVQNQECMSGIKLMHNDLRVAYFENEIPAEFEGNLRTIVGEGHEYIWCFEPEGMETLLKVASEPESENTVFAIIDVKGENIPENVTTLTFRENEGAFLAGFIAARTTESGTIGFLAGKEGIIADKYEYGYKAGIHYAEKQTGKKVNVVSLYTGDDYDKALGKESAKKLYTESGCDIIFQASQVTGLGAIEAAIELDKLIIGNGIDQSSYGPNNVLTSDIKNAKNSVNRVTTMFIEKEDVGGKNIEYGMKERVIGIAKTNTNMDKELYREAMNLSNEIIGEDIIVPHDEASYLEYIKE